MTPNLGVFFHRPFNILVIFKGIPIINVEILILKYDKFSLKL